MAKMVSYKALSFAIAIFVIASTNLIGSAFAWSVSNAYYSHAHVTDFTNPSLVCGNHKCSPGETPQHPVVVPEKETR